MGRIKAIMESKMEILLLAMLMFGVIGGLLAGAYRQMPHDATRHVEVEVNVTILFCPNCQTVGSIRMEPVFETAVCPARLGIALQTHGKSIPVIGLFREQPRTRAQCAACGSTWNLA